MLVDHFAGAEGVSDLSEVAHIGGRVAVEDDEIGVEAFFHPALAQSLKVRSRICREGSQDFIDGKSAAHQLKFKCGVVVRCKANVGPEEDGAAIRKKSLELLNAGSNQAARDGRVLHDGGPESEGRNQRGVLGLEASEFICGEVWFSWNRVGEDVDTTRQSVVDAGAVLGMSEDRLVHAMSHVDGTFTIEVSILMTGLLPMYDPVNNLMPSSPMRR